jgi:hypothetical protein
MHAAKEEMNMPKRRIHRKRPPGSGHGRPVTANEKLDYTKYIYYAKDRGGLRIFKANRKGAKVRRDTGAIHHSKYRLRSKKRDEMESSGW